MTHLNSRLSHEIRVAVGHLPPYPGDPTGKAIDYTNAPVAYAVNVTLLHGAMEWHPTGLYLPTARTKALLVQRASGDGQIGSESGVSGFIDILHDPQDLLTDTAFDPIAYAARAELHEECGIQWAAIRAIDLYIGAVLKGGINLVLGQRFKEPRFSSAGLIHVLPMLGLCQTPEPPPINPKPDELSSYNWIPLDTIAARHTLSPGYLGQTLPNALGSLGLRPDAIQALLRTE